MAGAPPTATSGLNPYAAQLFRIRKTCCAMLKKRGYNVPREDLEMTARAFEDRFGALPTRERLVLQVARVDDASRQMFVFFPENDVGVPHCKTYAARMRESNPPVRNAIIVVRGKFSNFAKLSLQELGPQLTIEHFRDEELMVDITEHELVPHHQLLTDADKAALLDRYTLKPDQLPRIQAGDPIARFLGLKRGEVVKINRPSETAGRYVTYRIVI